MLPAASLQRLFDLPPLDFRGHPAQRLGHRSRQIDLLPRAGGRRGRRPAAGTTGSGGAAGSCRRRSRITARSMQFCSSRTLPGHGYACSSSSAAGDSVSGFLFSRGRTARRSGAPGSATSSARSRSGGIWIGNTDSRKYRSSRNWRSATRCFRLRLVAATTRTSTCSDCVPPTRSNCFSSSARRILACSASGRSPISSRNSVPRCASSKRPGLRAAAPVNAPFSWPNSSVSSSVSGIAAQLIATNGPSARGLSACSARANSSLPVPLSPFEQDRRVGRRGAVQLLQTPAAACGSSPMIRGAPRRSASSSFSRMYSVEHPPLRDRALHHQQQVIGIDGLGQEVHRAFPHRRHGVLDAAVGGHDDDLQLGVELLGGAQHAEAVAGRQLQIGQDDGRTRLPQLLDRFGLVARFEDDVALRLERMAQHRPQRVLVFDEERLGKDGQRCSVTRLQLSHPAGRNAGARALLPGSRRSPWCAAAISFLTRSSSASAFCAIGGDRRRAAPDRRG